MFFAVRERDLGPSRSSEGRSPNHLQYVSEGAPDTEPLWKTAFEAFRETRGSSSNDVFRGSTSN
jgi:hypothetical protein